VRADDGLGFGAQRDLRIVFNQPPVVRKVNNMGNSGFTLATRQSISASSLFTVDDRDGDAIVQFELQDNNAGSGRFELNGVGRPHAAPFVISAGELKDLRLVGADSDGLFDFLQIRAFDGVNWSEAQSLLVHSTATGNLAPEVELRSFSATVAPGESASVMEMFTAFDPEGATLTYTFADHFSDGGFFTLDGERQNFVFTVTAAELPSVRFQAAVPGPTGGGLLDSVSVWVNDGTLQSPVHGWSIVTTANRLPTVSAAGPVLLNPGQKVVVAPWFTVTDPDNDPIRSYAFRDDGNRTDGGYFLVDGLRQISNSFFTVDASLLSVVEYVAGTVPGAESIHVSASSDLTSFHTASSEALVLRVTTSGTIADGAGNSLAAAREVSPGATALAFNDYLDSTTDPDDYYRLQLAVGGTLRLDVTRLTENADLRLLDASGAELAAGTLLGNASEHLAYAASAGTYYARITPVGGTSTYYDLTLSVG